MAGLVERTDSEGVAVLCLNRPDVLNALSPKLFEELRAHVERLAGETGSIGCVVQVCSMMCADCAKAASTSPRENAVVSSTLSCTHRLPGGWTCGEPGSIAANASVTGSSTV
jgi:hypothetical protein